MPLEDHSTNIPNPTQDHWEGLKSNPNVSTFQVIDIKLDHITKTVETIQTDLMDHKSKFYRLMEGDGAEETGLKGHIRENTNFRKLQIKLNWILVMFVLGIAGALVNYYLIGN